MRTTPLLPEVALAVLLRTTSEWAFGESLERKINGKPVVSRSLFGFLGGAALGAGLTLLFSTGARAQAREAWDAVRLRTASLKRRAPIATDQPSPIGVSTSTELSIKFKSRTAEKRSLRGSRTPTSITPPARRPSRVEKLPG